MEQATPLEIAAALDGAAAGTLKDDGKRGGTEKGFRK
jgi:hypothetical protein